MSTVTGFELRYKCRACGVISIETRDAHYPYNTGDSMAYAITSRGKGAPPQSYHTCESIGRHKTVGISDLISITEVAS